MLVPLWPRPLQSGRIFAPTARASDSEVILQCKQSARVTRANVNHPHILAFVFARLVPSLEELANSYRA